MRSSSLFIGSCLAVMMSFVSSPLVSADESPALTRIRVADDGRSFIDGNDKPFVIWGVNYDHDGQGRLLEDYWAEEWGRVVEDFREIRSLGCNVVRIHLQLAKFLDSPTQANRDSLERLRRLIELASQERLYIDLTGLACYHRDEVPAWYNALDESARWDAQALFWSSVAGVCKDSPALFCYNLMNEPILPGKKPETEWLAGELGGKTFVQRLTLDLDGRSREDVARAWIEKLTKTIRGVDPDGLITVGVIPWALTFPGAKPIFYAPGVGDSLDFVSVHFYPKQDAVAEAITALKVYDVGKPIVIEEMFPMQSDIETLGEFIDQSKQVASGWISFYWGDTREELRAKNEMAASITAAWLDWFAAHSPETAAADNAR